MAPNSLKLGYFIFSQQYISLGVLQHIPISNKMGSTVLKSQAIPSHVRKQVPNTRKTLTREC